ncbi:MAG: alanine racemase [Candidatus Omnitrophica bacterium]|nr:alanine racemase [Candidatus Omnitrophota bacterium]
MNKTKFIGYRPTWAEINLGNLVYNFNQIKRLVASGVKIMACVKADAYGHGLIPVSKKLVECGLDYLGVASVDEAIRLRKAHIRIPILVLGVSSNKEILPIIRYNITPTLCSWDFAYALNKVSQKESRRIKVHIKVDTGMGRIGILFKDAFRFISDVHRLRNINIEGVFTHFPCADIDRDFTLHQIHLIKGLISHLKKAGFHIPLFHAANSLGIVDYKESHFNMVRPGLILYGLYPKDGLNLKLKPVLSLKTKVAYIKHLPKGYGISYGRTYTTKRQTTVVTLPIGYGDGYPRNLSNQAPVLINSKRFRISGRICMDQIMVDVGSYPVKIEDEAVLIGSQGKYKITAEELARLSGTIPYEIVCGLGSRIPRIYISD